MLNKESVVTWFQGLDGAERVDLMCLLLDCCLPWEVRFFGTYLESLAQKDFAALRGPESTANNPSELGYLYCIEDSDTRKRLCVSVALLHSTNRQAAGVLFDILNDLHVQLFGTSAVEDEIFTELSLLLTMTTNHPAFCFNQKNILRSKLKQLREFRSSCSDWSEECFETISESSTTSSTFFSDPDPTDNDEENQNEIEKCGVESRAEKTFISESDDTKDPPSQPSAYVKDFKVVKIQKKCECKFKHEARTRRDDHEYVLEVSWSDDSKETICKTYEEMFDFQCKLRKLFPNKIDEKGQTWKLPFLPGRLRPFSKDHKNSADRAPIPDISDYARHFGSLLPTMVLGCEHVVRFFESYKNPRLPDSKSRKGSCSKTKKASSKTEEKIISKCKDSDKNKEKEKVKGNKKETVKVFEKGRSREEAQKEKDKIEFKAQEIPQCSESRKVLKDRRKNFTSKLSESIEVNGFVEDAITTNISNSVTNCRLTKNEILICSKQSKPNLDEKCLDRKQESNLIGHDENQNHFLAFSSSPSISSSFGSSTSSSSGEENITNSSLADHSQIVASLIRNIKEKNGISKSVIPSVKPCTAAVTSGSMAPTFTTSSEREIGSPISTNSFSKNLTPYSVTNGMHDLKSLPNFQPHCVPHSLSNSPQFHSTSLGSSSSPSSRRRSKLGSLNWTFKSHSHSMTVRDWLKSLRLHKYFDLFQHKTFDQMLKISDKDMESLKMPLGARRKLRANLEVLRSRGCFTADGNAVVDILTTPAPDNLIRVPYASRPTNGFNLTCGSGVPYSLPPSGTSVVTVSKMVSVGDSDSASECGSDAHSESNCNIVQMPCKPLNGYRLFCYNCGSLGHVGGQCMAPNMEKRIKYYGFHLKYDSL